MRSGEKRTSTNFHWFISNKSKSAKTLALFFFCLFHHASLIPGPFHQLTEGEGLQRIRNHDCRGHADEGDETDRADGRMDGKEQWCSHDDKDDSWEEDGHFVPGQHAVIACSRFGQQAFGDENAIVDTHTKDKRGDDDVDEVEFQA